MTTWLTFWDGDHAIYVSARHKAAHADQVLSDISTYLHGRDCRVLDFGCGEARYAEALALRCGELVLCEAAQQVRARLGQRLAGIAGCRVIGGDELECARGPGFDLIVVNSVAQYISRDELAVLMGRWRDVLAEGGRLVLADIIRPDTGPLTDALSLLRFAWREGFVADAVIGLSRVAMSDYRRLRGELGLATYRPDDIRAMLRSQGLSGELATRNFGHNQARFTILAQKA